MYVPTAKTLIFSLIPNKNISLKIANILLIKAPMFKSMYTQALIYPRQTYVYAIEYLGKYSYGTDYNYEYEPFRDGVQHGDELMYTFAQPDYTKNFNAKDRKFSDLLVNLWTSFAISGVPVADGIPKWPPMTSKH